MVDVEDGALDFDATSIPNQPIGRHAQPFTVSVRNEPDMTYLHATYTLVSQTSIGFMPLPMCRVRVALEERPLRQAAPLLRAGRRGDAAGGSER